MAASRLSRGQERVTAARGKCWGEDGRELPLYVLTNQKQQIIPVKRQQGTKLGRVLRVGDDQRSEKNCAAQATCNHGKARVGVIRGH